MLGSITYMPYVGALTCSVVCSHLVMCVIFGCLILLNVRNS